MKPPVYYRVAIAFAKPIYRLILSLNSKKRESVGVVSQADEFAMRYARKLPDKLTLASAKKNTPCVWIHAVSLGETNTVAPIIEKLLADGYQIVVTNTTHTGFSRTQKLFAGRVNHSFIPVDSPKQIAKFIDYYQPKSALFMETELWANTLYVLKKNQIPSLLINARLSEKSFNNYQKFAKVSQSMMANLTHIICQDSQSQKRFEALGALPKQISLSPSLKYAVSVPNDALEKANVLRSDWQLDNRTIILGASTHDGEEAMMLAVYAELLKTHTDIVLMLVPRHPERFDTVVDLVASKGFTPYRRSAEDSIDADTQVYIADSMGELFTWYALSDIALVAGSFVPDIGGHNPLEACILSKPVIMGKYTHKCQYIVDDLTAHDAIRTVLDHQALYELLDDWLYDMEKAKKIGKAGLAVMQNNQDTVEQQYVIIKRYLS